MASQDRSEPLVGRLAPSPTGLLHVGHARSFLLAWWSVRSRRGRMVLRIEDLDAQRSAPVWIDAAQRDIEWLGLDWDGDRVVQSEGLDDLRAAIDDLVERGTAYPCVCSRADVRRAQGAPHAGDKEARYPGTCRDRYTSVEEAERASGRHAGLRFRVPDGEVVVEDAIAGTHRFDVAATIGDFMIARRDKIPAYQLAVVVDDAASAVTEVLRGDDLLASAARQQLLQGALRYSTPGWAHVPLVVDESGRRLAKRAGDLSLAELRSRGVDPRAVVAWAAKTAGLDVPARATAAEVVPIFDLSRLPRAPVPVVGDDPLLGNEREGDPPATF